MKWGTSSRPPLRRRPSVNGAYTENCESVRRFLARWSISSLATTQACARTPCWSRSATTMTQITQTLSAGASA